MPKSTVLTIIWGLGTVTSAILDGSKVTLELAMSKDLLLFVEVTRLKSKAFASRNLPTATKSTTSVSASSALILRLTTFSSVNARKKLSNRLNAGQSSIWICSELVKM